MKKLILSFVLLSLSLTGCAHSPKAVKTDPMVMATLWAATSGEARALSYQAFALARLRLELDLTQKSDIKSKPRAIVSDLDETLFDNSGYEAWLIRNNTSYPDGWAAWVNGAKAKAMPGALEFLRFADKKGVKIFYVTANREKFREGVEKILKKLEFPQMKREQVMLKTDKMRKKNWRKKIAQNHRIVLLLGDSLHDFHADVVGKSSQERMNVVDRLQGRFGKQYVVFPNPMYGDWYRALGEYKNLTPKEQESVHDRVIQKIVP